jgi:CRISPR/Cas system-associated endonuclease Cas1
MQIFQATNHWKQLLSKKLYNVLPFLEKYENTNEKKLQQQLEDFDLT